MASAQDLRKRIKSVTNTQQITKAMKMVASARLRRAQTKAEATRPYAEKIGQILRHMSNSDLEGFESPLLDVRPVERTCYIVVGADKGLAGAYNHNVIKKAHELFEQSEHNRLFVVGELGRQYFAREGLDVDTNFQYTVQNPSLHRARVIVERIMELYMQNEVDEIDIVYTKMENAFLVETEVLKLLPLDKEDFESAVPVDVYQEELKAEPSLESVLDHMVPNYVTGFVYGALVESYASEQNSRMMAMEAASKSAKEMLQLLQVEYNRVRQAAITQEITEVISGAKAQKRKKKK